MNSWDNLDNSIDRAILIFCLIAFVIAMAIVALVWYLSYKYLGNKGTAKHKPKK